MISIDDVVSNKYFSAFKGYRTLASGKVLSFSLWNPEDSGVYAAIRQVFNYTQPYTALNVKWRTKVPVGTLYTDRNSMFLRNPTSLLATSKANIVTNDTGPYNPNSDADNYALFAVDKDPAYDYRPEVPMVLTPGTGIIWYSDTSANMDWTIGMTWEEQEIPAP